MTWAYTSAGVTKDGITRRIFDDTVQWMLQSVMEDEDVAGWHYAVHRFAFVPDYHIVRYQPEDDDWCDIVSTHRTLAEAVSILKVLLANGGLRYV